MLFVSQDQCDLVYLDSPLQSPRATVTRLFVRQDLCDLVSLDFSPVLLSPGSLGARTSVTWYPYVVPLCNPSRATVDQALCEPGLSIFAQLTLQMLIRKVIRVRQLRHFFTVFQE